MNFSAQIAFYPYFPACVLRATGPDAPTFLQGQFTNDLGKMTTGSSAYGLWLDRRGRVIADSQVIRGLAVNEFLIVSASSESSVVAAHLQGHLIADEVEISDETRAWRGVALVGQGAGGWLASAPRPGFAFRGRRSSAENFDWVMPLGEWPAAAEATSGMRQLDEAETELMRIRSAIPRIPVDIGPGDLPNEGGLDAQAISYSKGCYLGQEVMARVKALGRVRRGLVQVAGTGEPPAVPAALWSGESRAGELRSVARDAGGFAGLALVTAELAAGAGAFSLTRGAAPTVTKRGFEPGTPDCV